MILVAGLVIAALAGIGAAFYYSVRPGSSPVRAGARPGRAGTVGFAGSRGRNSRPSPSNSARPSSSARSAGSTSSRAASRAGPEPMTASAGPEPMTASAGPEPMTGPGEDPTPPVADLGTQREASAGPRWRVAWRKGTDIEQELWPIETFGGISDEQFWDDLAADKPLATTARTAQADSGASTRPARAYPATRQAAADRTAAQPAVQSVQAAPTPFPMAAQPHPARTQPSTGATQPVHAAHQPTESRGRRSTAAGAPGGGEDPLTSPAYSLRPKGAVDGRSYQSSNRPASGGTAGAPAYQPGPGSAGRYGGTAARPYPGQPHGQPARSAQSMSTPAYGDTYGYQNPAGPADDPRSANGNRGHGRPRGNDVGGGNWGSHRPVNGDRGPYDPYGRR